MTERESERMTERECRGRAERMRDRDDCPDYVTAMHLIAAQQNTK